MAAVPPCPRRGSRHLTCLEAPRHLVEGQVFNVGSDEDNHRVADLGALIQELLPDVHVTYDLTETDPADYRVEFKKIRQILDFVPRRTLVEGIAEVKAAIESGEIRDYRARRYNKRALLHRSSTFGTRRSQRWTLPARPVRGHLPSHCRSTRRRSHGMWGMLK